MNLLKFTKYAPRFFIKKGMPLNLIYFVTSKCNARCRHCFYWKEINKTKKQLSLEQIEKIAKSVPNLLSLSLTGGEPFLRKDLAQIASLFSKFSKVANIQIPTNGILTDEILKETEEILNKCRDDIRIIISVSIDNFEKKHDAIRQVNGCFQKAVDTIKKLKPLEFKFPNFRVDGLITMTKENQKELFILVEFLKEELNLKEIGVNIVRSEVRDMSLKDLEIKYYDEIMKKFRKDFFERLKNEKISWPERVLSSRQYYGSQLLKKIYIQNKYLTPCYAGSLLAIMTEEGDVYPCEMLNDKIGNLEDFDFNLKKLWFSKEAKEVRKKIKNQKCFCTYECAMTLNTLFNPYHLFCIFKGTLQKSENSFSSGSPSEKFFFL